MGGPEGQGPYLNVVVELSTGDTPRAAPRALPGPRGGGRPGAHVRWGPRTLDADVLWSTGGEVDEPDLIVPHPRMWERRFVVRPWPTWRPTWSRPAQLRASGGEVVRMGSL